MLEETRDFIVPIRMTYSEKDKIKSRAKKTGKNLSKFIRDCSLGCEIKEKPNEELFRELIKQMRDMQRAVEKLKSYSPVNKSIIEQESKKWNDFIIETKKRFL